MTTRCQIGFYRRGEKDLKNWEALIYRHSDGYPDRDSGVLADIVPILNDFNQFRGLSDTEYAAAWLVAKLKTDYLNIGICKNFHGDIDYFYAVYPDEMVIYETPWDGNPEAWREIQRVPLKKEVKNA